MHCFAPVVLGLAVCAGFAALPNRAHACSCVSPPEPAVAAEQATAVFEGKTQAPVNDGDRNRFTFTVTRSFKGEVPASVEIVTTTHEASCGRNYEPDKLYLVYASATSDGQLVDNLCSRSQLAATATDDFSALGEGTPLAIEAAAEPEQPVSEPPRIEAEPESEPNTEPPPIPSASDGKGCTAGRAGSRGLLWGALLCIAGLRRRAYRGSRRTRHHVARHFLRPSSRQ